jgi:hypothetical protein
MVDLVPVQFEGQVAPDSVLTVVRCKCKGDCSSALCSCKKYGLQCVTACSNCHGTDCSNALPHNAHDIDEDSDVDDETSIQNLQMLIICLTSYGMMIKTFSMRRKCRNHNTQLSFCLLA